MSSRSSISKMGEHIAELRKSKGYTQKNLGDILDISDKTVSKWEQGIVAPDITILDSLASTLGISIEELLLGEEVEKENTAEAIEVYSNITKRKMIKIFIFILAFILTTFIVVFRVENYYRWHITSLFSKGDISSIGYIINNSEEAKIIIDKISIDVGKVDESILNQLVNNVKFELINNDRIIYDKNIAVKEEKTLKNVLDNQSLIFDYNKSIDTDKLELKLTFINDNGNK